MVDDRTTNVENVPNVRSPLLPVDLGKMIQPKSLGNGLVGMGFGCIALGAQAPNLEANQRWTLQGFGALLLVVGLVVHVFKGSRSGAKDGVEETDRAFRAVMKAVERLRTDLARDRLVRSELLFHLTLAQHSVANIPNHGRVETATIDLSVSFKIENLSVQQVAIPLVAGFEASAASVKSEHTGSLSISRTRPNGDVDADQRQITFSADPRRPIARAHEYRVDMPPGSSARVRWTANYVVDLPYGEFWATSVPTVGMGVEVSAALDAQFDITADCYGGSRDSFKRLHPKNTGGAVVVHRHVFEEAGPLLPYQGIFLRIRTVAEGV